MTAQAPEQRLRELRDLRARINAEIRRTKAEIAAAKPKRPPRRPRDVIPPCGTESAYQRHRHYRELADRACLDAHAAHERDRIRRLAEARWAERRAS
jgi:hypothetical protein